MVELRKLSLFLIPLWVVFFYLYFALRKERLFVPSLAAKCGGTFLAVMSAGLALFAGGEKVPGKYVILFSVLCMVGDAVLEISFLPGMAIFGAGHITLIVYLWQTYHANYWNFILWAAAVVIAAVLFRRELPRMGAMLIPCILYAAALSGILAMSLPAPFTAGGAGAWHLAAGTLCFYCSDLMVAKDQFSHLGEPWQKPIMILYWLAHYLIAASLWL